ncbi:MAG: ArsR/SmtB family transcription factor [Solirubrobacterales bacterium]
MAAKGGKPKASKTPKVKTRPAWDLVDIRLMKALSHKERVEILSILSEREASPNELSEIIKVGLSKTAYHVKVLKDFDLIELVRTEPRRGALEHFYRAKQRAIFPEELWEAIPKGMRKGITRDVMGDALDDIGSAVEAGTFDARDEFHLSWIPALLDAEAWTKLMKALIAFVELVIDTQAEASVRLAESGEDGIATTFALFGFESARNSDDGVKKASARKRG